MFGCASTEVWLRHREKVRGPYTLANTICETFGWRQTGTNQFMGQEPGSEAEILSFCTSKYDVTFPMFAKIEVNGGAAHPLYQWLKSQPTQPDGPGEVSWNFAKFLLDRNGRVAARFAPKELPTSTVLRTALETALAAG